MDKPVLFITHDLARAGAQMFLMHLMRWVRERGLFDFELLVSGPSDGPAAAPAYAMRAEAEALCKLHWLDGQGLPTNIAAVRSGAYSLLYANTVTHGPLLARMQPFETPVLCHVHELRYYVLAELGKAQFDAMRPLVRHWVACADVVRQMLVGFGVPAEQIDVVHECIPVAQITAAAATMSRAEARGKLGVSDNTFLVMLCGTLDWRKGYGKLVPLIQALRRARPELDFCVVWLGVNPNSREYPQIMYEIVQAEVARYVKFIPSLPQPAPWLAAGDVFVLLSREDPFPLVMLEAAACGLPVVGFARSGGVTEFVTDEMGFTVPFDDLGAMADGLAALAAEPERRERLASQARQRAAQFDVEHLLPRFAKSIEFVLSRPPCHHG